MTVDQALEDLAAVLAEVGALVEQVGRPAPDMLLARPGAGAASVAVRVRGLVRADPARVAGIVAGASGPGRAAPATVLVADLVPDKTRQMLRAAGWGWLDRRGHLRLQAPGLLLDTVVTARTRVRLTTRPAVTGRGGITWASALLMEPARPPGLREVARRAGMAPSTLAAAAAALRDAELVDGRGRPRMPDLFWALTDAWRPEWTPVAAPPDGLEGAAGVAAGFAAARAHGAPAADGPDTMSPDTPALYLRTAADVTRVVHQCGRCHPDLQAARVAVAPTSLVAATAVAPRPGPGTGMAWPVAHPLFAALDLTNEPGGAELLARWRPAWIR